MRDRSKVRITGSTAGTWFGCAGAHQLIHCRTVRYAWGNGYPLTGYQGGAIEPEPGPKGMRVIARLDAEPAK